MMIINQTHKRKKIYLLAILMLCLTSCEDVLDVDGPKGQIQANVVFEDELTATATVTTLYSHLRDNTLLTGSTTGLNVLLGFYADELAYYSTPGSPLEAFYNHQIAASNVYVKNLWDTGYKLIYLSNSIIEGLDASPNLSIATKNQLKGEALFIRSLTYFYLVNLFGDIPYITTTDYTINKEVTRMEEEELYGLIISDLLNSKSLLSNDYISNNRVRANRFVVSALLSRVYLFRTEWSNAEKESSELLEKTDTFHLESDLNNEFLMNSSSTILQLKPKLDGENTKEAGVFLFESGPPRITSLNPYFVNSFELEDLRKYNWIKEIGNGTNIWYAPFKYKSQEYTGNTVEHSIILRLAEQYLIRAEARTHLGNFIGAKQDINTIRNRAGLPDTEAILKEEILQTIVSERKFELFTEQGHRWFDLKRLGIAEETLAPLKDNWMSKDVLLPIPEVELGINPNLVPQNPGY